MREGKAWKYNGKAVVPQDTFLFAQETTNSQYNLLFFGHPNIPENKTWCLSSQLKNEVRQVARVQPPNIMQFGVLVPSIAIGVLVPPIAH